MSELLTFACITQNRLKNLKRTIPHIIDYFDKIVIVDAFSTDGTKEWLEAYSPKIFVAQRKWDDNFSNQHNEYLKHINQGWLLVCDDDELPSKGMLENLRKIAEESSGGFRYCAAEFRCHGLEVDGDGKIVLDPGVANFYKEIFFKYNPGMHYKVNLHQSMTGYFIDEKKNRKARLLRRCEEIYYHLKTNENLYRSACRNWWVAGIWPAHVETLTGIKCPEWYEMKSLVKAIYPEVDVYSELDSILVKGNIDQRLKDFFIKHKDIQDEPDKMRWLNELRAYWKYYFEILHPEER